MLAPITVGGALNHMKRIITIIAVLIFIVVSFLFYDRSVALYFHRADFFGDFFQVVTELGRAEFYLVPSVLLFLIYRKKSPVIKRSTLLMISSVAVSGMLVNILKIIFGRYRPKLLFNQDLYGFAWFQIGYDNASFPSGHSTTVFSGFVALALIWPRYRYFFYAMAVLIAFSRVAIGAHYPSDVAAGALLGSLTAIMLSPKILKVSDV